jgi:hypothetical protein
MVGAGDVRKAFSDVKQIFRPTAGLKSYQPIRLFDLARISLKQDTWGGAGPDALSASLE